MSDTKNIHNYTKLEDLSSFVNQLLRMNADFAVWNLPGHDEIKLLASFNGITKTEDTSFEQFETGFLLSPFIGTTSFIPAQFIWSSKNGVEKSYPGIEINDNSNSESASFPVSKKVESTNESDYIEYVKYCITEIEQDTLQKVVPARVKHEALTIYPLELFKKLVGTYSQSFISLLSVKEYGTWIGASPELLVSTNKNNIFKTVSLAGTQLNKGYQNLRDVLWTQKEIEEQAMVSRYIINSFKKIRLREFGEFGPKSVIAGNLLHLKTEFEVDMEATNFPQLGSVMLKLLHPTSAVCGMPLEKSRDFIANNEKLDRKLYSGYLGPVNINGDSSIYVNLRCLELTEDGANFYAGAGVTVDSDPKAEFNETEIKIDTLKNLI